MQLPFQINILRYRRANTVIAFPCVATSARNECVVHSILFTRIDSELAFAPMSRSDRLRNNCDLRSRYENYDVVASSMNTSYNWHATFATPVTRRRDEICWLMQVLCTIVK